LGDNLVMARDGTGRFYLPAYDYDDMGVLREGGGYQVRVGEAAELTYRLGQGASLGLSYSASDVSWLAELRPTGSMHHLLIEGGFEAGTRIEAFTPGGVLAGRGVVVEGGRAGVTLWGDDPSTEAVDGFLPGEEPNFKFQISNFKLLAGSFAFTDGGWGVVEVGGSSVPSEFGLTGIYPNPFNSTTTISFSLPSSSSSSLFVYDIAGREAAVIGAGSYSAGIHRISWRADDLPAGVYLLRLESGAQSSMRKVVIVK
jgi:hypothetical protein